MALLKGANIVTGLAIGIGAGVIAPMLAPILKPFANSAIKAGLVAYDQARVAFAELNERTGDVMAEARAEVEEARKAAAEQPKSADQS